MALAAKVAKRTLRYGRADNAGDWIYTDTDLKAIRAWIVGTIDPDQRA
jgi:hypothetical protein